MISLNRNFMVSVGIIFVTSVLGSLLRKFVDSLRISEFNRQLVYEAIATFELCANCFEFSIVMENNGFLPYSVLMIFLFNYWGKTWKASASVCSVLISVFENTSNLSSAILTVLSQGLGASAAYYFYIKHIWSLGFQQKHLERLIQTDCYTHLQVSPIQGAVVEAVAIFMFLSTIKIFGSRKYGFLTMPLSMLVIIYTAMNYTGGYFNPILASTAQFGCSGITLSDHLIVYWLGPAIGSLLYLYSGKAVYSMNKTIKLN